MQEIYTLLIPLLVISLLARSFQYLFNSNRFDKIISLTIITIIQLASVIFLVSFFNGDGFSLFLFLSVIVIVMTNALQVAFDSQDLDIKMSKGTSMLITFLIQGLVLTGLYFIVH